MGRRRIPILYLMIAGCLFTACQKELTSSNASGSGIPPRPDTLTAGWSKVTIAGEKSIADIFFSSPAIGFAVGSKIYKSVDSGHTWRAMYTGDAMSNIYMLDDALAFFVHGDILSTDNGGNSFTTNNGMSLAQDVFILDNVFGYATSYNGFFQSYNGRPWTRIYTVGLNLSGGYSSLFFISSSAGWVVSSTGIYSVVNTVTSWQKATVTGGSGAPFEAVFASSASVVYVANYQGELYKSTNGGLSFNRISQFGISGFMDLHFVDDLHGYASIGRFIFQTSNGGASWTKVLTAGQGQIHEIHFVDSAHGWACADAGDIYIYNK